MSMLSLGVDQSTTDTGLCLISFEIGQPGGYGNHWKPVRCATAKTPEYFDMCRVIAKFFDTDIPVVACAEWGYVGPNVESAFSTIRTATWVECFIRSWYYPDTVFRTASAMRWRNKVWYEGAGSMPRAQAKAYSIDFAHKAGLPVANDHEGDALGLAIMGMYRFLLDEEQDT